MVSIVNVVGMAQSEAMRHAAPRRQKPASVITENGAPRSHETARVAEELCIGSESDVFSEVLHLREPLRTEPTVQPVVFRPFRALPLAPRLAHEAKLERSVA